MAISSIHIEAGAGGYFAHNSRESHTVNSVFTDEQNFCSCTKEEAFETYRSELEKRTEAYTDRTGQKLQKNAITHLSAIVNFNKEHTPEDMQKVCDLLEKRFDTKVIQFAMHRDEGKSIDDKNYHAHIEFMGLDSKGESVRRKLDRPTLKALQTDVAKLLGMERGHDYAKERLPRPKRLDTYEWKAHKEEQSKAVLATEKDLKAEIARLREQLKEQGASRSDYASLEQINRELKEQIKAKDLTISDLKTALEAPKAQQPQNVQIEAEGAVDHPLSALSSLRPALEEQGKKTDTAHFSTLIEKHTGLLGRVDKEALAHELSTEAKANFKTAATVFNIANEAIKFKDKLKEVLKHGVESSKTALKSIFSLGEGKSLSEEKKGVETPEEAKERIQKFLAEQKAKKQSKGMSR